MDDDKTKKESTLKDIEHGLIADEYFGEKEIPDHMIYRSPVVVENKKPSGQTSRSDHIGQNCAQMI